MSQMNIKDLAFKELLPNQEIETVVGGTQSLLSNEIIRKTLVTVEAVSLSSNVTISTEILVSDSCGCTIGLGPHGPLPLPLPGPGPSGGQSIPKVIVI